MGKSIKLCFPIWTWNLSTNCNISLCLQFIIQLFQNRICFTASHSQFIHNIFYCHHIICSHNALLSSHFCDSFVFLILIAFCEFVKCLLRIIFYFIRLVCWPINFQSNNAEYCFIDKVTKQDDTVDTSNIICIFHFIHFCVKL